ncbi:hypothetical protein [Nonomuraea cavernae]|uniref:hypothetical protein n=1 Tax=Nonomuraea cavernae TaxID=2045107 RepID=UPI00166F50A8|nr:hypothetical protein [Nonomuraea cavernae]
MSSIPVSAVTDDSPPGRLLPPRIEEVAGASGTGRDSTGGAAGGGAGRDAAGGSTGGAATGVGTGRARSATGGARGNPAAEFGFSGDPGQHGTPDDDMLHAQRVWDGTLATNRLDDLGVNTERQRVETADVTITVGVLVDGRPDDVRRSLRSVLDHTSAAVLALDLGDVDGAGRVLRELAEEYPERVIAWHVAERPAWHGGTASWGESRTKLMRLDTSEVHVLLETLVTLDGDAITPLVAAVYEGAVAAGWMGYERDGDNWREAAPGRVAALSGDLMAVRRSVALGASPEDARDGFELSRALRGELVVPRDRLEVRRTQAH